MNPTSDISDIIRKYLHGFSTPSELKQAMDFLADPSRDPELRAELERWWKSDQNKQTILSVYNPTAMLHAIHHRINLQKKHDQGNTFRKIVWGSIKVAAILAFGFIIGILANKFQKTEPVFFTSMAPKGSVSQMILPDNTMVYLNSGSQIRYSVGETNGKRELFLSGEAWFDVTKNDNKPFVVRTSAYNVQVTGTQFNVKAYPNENEITTTLEEGSVEVTSLGDGKQKANRTLTPGQQLIFNQTDGSVAVKEVNTRLFSGWKENKLIFINMNLSELIVLLERKYGVEIETADDLMLDYHYDGTIKSETILEVLELLKETLPINYKIAGQKVIIQNK